MHDEEKGNVGTKLTSLNQEAVLTCNNFMFADLSHVFAFYVIG